MNVLWTVKPKIITLPTKQKTIQKPIHYCWIHPFKHTKNTLILYPAPANSWIVIKLDWYLFKLSPLHVDFSTEDDYTTLVVGENRLAYVEHLFAALLWMWITNIIIDVPDWEIPVIDWSSKLYTQLILHAWITEQDFFQEWLAFESDAILCAEEWASIINICPADELSIISTDNLLWPLWLQSALYRQSTSNFVWELSTSREFLKTSITQWQLQDRNNHRHDLIHPYFQDRDWMIAYSDSKVFGWLLSSNEPAKHQIIDILWCLQLLGMPIVGSFKCYKPTQSMMRWLIKKIYSSIPKLELRAYNNQHQSVSYIDNMIQK